MNNPNSATSQMQSIRENQLSLFLQEQAAIKAVQLRKISLAPSANKRVYDPKALEFIVYLLFLEEMKDITTYKRGAKRKKNHGDTSGIREQADDSSNKNKIGYSSLCQYANAIVNLWTEQHSVKFQN